MTITINFFNLADDELVSVRVEILYIIVALHVFPFPLGILILYTIISPSARKILSVRFKKQSYDIAGQLKDKNNVQVYHYHTHNDLAVK